MNKPTAHTEVHHLILTKPAQRSLQEKVINNNTKSLLTSINTRALAVRGWELAPHVPEGAFKKVHWVQKTNYGGDTDYVYNLHFSLTFTRQDGKKPESGELGGLLRTISTRCGQPAFGRWALGEVDGEAYTSPALNEEEEVFSADALTYAEVAIPEEWDEHFSHLYGLDAQIARIKRALEAGDMSEWTSRFHCALIGPPGCGKSDICQSIKRALGEDAVLEFDATATTAAGAIKELSEREILPRIILIEEIEKADEKAMSFLLSVLDLRGSVRKTTARNTIVRDTKLFAIATVNDVPLFERLQAGALASRFSNRITFKRPEREQLKKILTREVKSMKGDLAWIDPTLDYAEEAGITDPRRITAICLCGREMLLTGEYQKMLADTSDNYDGVPKA